MLSTDELYNIIIENYRKLEEIPGDAHALCPKLDDFDVTNYDDLDEPGEDITVEEKKQRIKDGEARLNVCYKLGLMLGLNEDQVKSWLDGWKSRVEGCLRKCDQCVRNWHSGREEFLGTLSDLFDDNVRAILEQKLNFMDKERIDKALALAEDLLRSKGPLTTSQLAKNSPEAAIGLLEALCSMPYLSAPENRVRFNYVFETTQQKKPLKMLGMIPTMTFFLFDPDPYRNTFARTAWENMTPGSLKQKEWDWAVQNHLAEAITQVAFGRGAFPTVDKIKRFWEGCLLILRVLSERQIVHWLRAMEVQPSVYVLALEHCVRVDSDNILALLMRALRTLMEKSPKAFWAAYDESQATPNVLVEQIFTSPAFESLLAESLVPAMMVEEDGCATPALAAWVNAFIKSLPLNRQTTLSQFLLPHLFEKFRNDPRGTEDGRATCTLAGLNALHQTLEGFLDPSARVDAGTSLIYINTLINLVVKYQEIIVSSARLRLEDKYTIGRSVVAQSVIRCALALDSKAIRVEWNAIHENGGVRQTMERQSAEMWDAFTPLLWYHPLNPRLKVAASMLMALMPLRSIEQFRADRNEKLTDDIKLQFNARYHKMAKVIGKMLSSLTEFPSKDLHSLCVATQPQTIYPIVASVIHGEQDIREAGIGLLKFITAEDRDDILPRREDAIRKMLEDYFSQFLDAFCDAIRNMTFGGGSHRPWGPMNPILELSEDILNGLCDPSSGLLRTRTLTSGEIGAVKRWWEVMWMCISFSFRSIRSWHEKIEKKTCENFFRSNMELADKHLAQDGLLASVFGQQKKYLTLPSDSDDDAATAGAMKEVLEHPSRNSLGFVEMLQIRDLYLGRLCVDILVKLARRLKENDMVFPHNSISAIHDYCRKNSNGEYGKKSNLTDMQRAEILKALGEDADDTDDDDVQYVASKPILKGSVTTAKKPSTLPDFFKAQTQSGTSIRTARDDVLDLTSSVEKNRSTLDLMRARQAAKSEQKPKPQPQLDQKAILAKQSSLKEARQKARAEKAKRDAEAIAKAKALRQKTVPGEGSGLQSIAGVKGKDHSVPQKDEMMVGSSSEDDDESEDDDVMLMSRAKAGQKPKSKSGMTLLAEKRPVRKVKVQRSAKDMRARLIPPMHVLHQAILEWDIFHDGNDPPNGYTCTNVAHVYSGPHNYKQTFFPLLVSEAWRSFVTSKDEATSKPYGVKILTRMSVDNFLEVTTAMPVAQNKDLKLSEGDIVIISKAENPQANSQLPHCLARIWKTTYKKGSLEVIYRVSVKIKQILSVLVPSAEFFALKITNMTTIEREYAALESLQYYDLMDEILKAQPSPILEFGDQAVKDVMANYNLNPGQAKAILNAKENDGFTLVQGPPGTGKTKTIVAMVGALLTGVLKPTTGAVPLSRPGGANAQAASGMAKKLLICAPSNAAVDELVLRLKAGVKTTTGSFHKLAVLRLGRSDAINAAVKDVTLDELVNARMNIEMKNNEFSDWDKMHKQAGEIKQKLTELRAALEVERERDDRSPAYLKLQREFADLRQRQAHMGARIDTARDSGNTYAREVEIKRRQIQQEILDKAQVICSTLSGSGHEMFKNLNVEFETVIIDEAAQCVELSALIPLKYGCSKCILVGDPKQLPPTVLSQSAARYGYDQSLFVRMQHNHPEDVHLLDRQYRMHPEISQFPSQEFYEGRLADGADMATLRQQPWHESLLLGPYRFFDVRGIQTRGGKGQSLVNMEEIKVALQLYQRFRTDYGRHVDLKAKIGIITPYKAQLFSLRDHFIRQYGDAITDQIEFNTTDAFQGRECEIIIFSCVRASSTGGIGFMTDIRRMNVGLTRAKSSLWILGDSRALVQGEYWGKLISNAKSRDRYTDGDVLAQLGRPSVKRPGFDASRTASPLTLKPLQIEEPSVKEEKPDVEMLDYDDYEPLPAQPDSKISDSEDYEPPPAKLENVPSSDDYEPPPAAPDNLPRRAGPSLGDVLPKALPPKPQSSYPQSSKPFNHTKAPTARVMGQPHVEAQQSRQPNVPLVNPRSTRGVNERGEVVPTSTGGVQRPVINSSSPSMERKPDNKRYLDLNSDHPAAKRMKNAPSVLSRNNQTPRAPRAYKPPPTPLPPRDPSAMEVLGLVPPTRAAATPVLPAGGGGPPPRPPYPPTNQPGPSGRPGGPPNAPQGPRKVVRTAKPADPFIKRKPR